MKTSVRWVFQRTPEGTGAQKPAVCVTGKTSMLCLAAGPPVRILKRPLAEVMRCRPVRIKGEDGTYGEEYPPLRAAEELSRHANGDITPKAAELLAHVLDDDDSFILNEDDYNDEENDMSESPESVIENRGNGRNGNGATTMSVKDKSAKKAKTTKAKAEKVVKIKAKTTKAKTPKAEKKAKAPRTTFETLMVKRLENIKPETMADAEWRKGVVKDFMKEHGVSPFYANKMFGRAKKQLAKKAK